MRRYLIMHGEKPAAMLTEAGECRVLDPVHMPYALWLEESDELDERIQNMINFYFWCASRLITLDRQYAKEILSSIGAFQARTDRERAQIALSYHCLSLTDTYWVREEEEEASWDQINLYDNHLSNALVDISLRGRHITATNQELAPDLSTSGCFPKAWQRREDGFYLLKGGGREAVEREVLASRICQCFDCFQVIYHQEYFEDQPVSVSKIFTDKKYSIVTREDFEIYAVNHEWKDLAVPAAACQETGGIDPLAFIKRLDPKGYYMMNILDYLTGNTDRHWGNWGLLVENKNNRPVMLHPLMDMNRAFTSCEETEGAGCLPEYPRRISQLQAAREAVRALGGLPEKRDIDPAYFAGHEDWLHMFQKRLQILVAAG